MTKKRVKKNSSVTVVSPEEKSAHQCKNCFTEGDGQFCAFCGQRYHAHKESFGELAYEFISDFLHFDSRFFKTVLPLLFSPGTLTKSYNEGRQRSQFHPIRLYLFSSVVYFFLFFTFNNWDDKIEESHNPNPDKFQIDSAQHASQIDSIKRLNANLSQLPENITINTEIPEVHVSDDKKQFVVLKDSTTQYKLSVTAYIDSLLTKKVTPGEYLAQQKTLNSKKRAGFFKRTITLQLLRINLKGDEGKKEFFRKMSDTFLHHIPKMLFFLLPVFAFLLKLLYFRHKQFYYVDHAILSLHYFSLIFLLLIFSIYVLDKIFGVSYFSTLAVIWIFLYLLIAMKKLYGQSWKKTTVKYIALGFLFLITVLITLFANIVVTALVV